MATTPLYLNQRSHAASDPMRNFRFLVKFIPPDDTLKNAVKFDAAVGFMAITGLSATTEAIPYREGGFNTTYHYLPGMTTFNPVTFQRGIPVGSRQSWDWFKQLYDTGYGESGETGPTGHFRCTTQIHVLAHPQPRIKDYDLTNPVGDPVVQQFSLMNSWITNITYSDLNAQDNAVLLEQITLVHEGLSARFTDKRIDYANPQWNTFEPSDNKG